MIPCSRRAYQLFHDGQEALADVESNGIALDIPYLERTSEKCRAKAEEIQDRLMDTNIGRLWKRRYRREINLDSDQQLAQVLFAEGMFESKKKTKGGEDSVDEESLLTIDDPFIPSYINYRKLRKMEGTYLKNLLLESHDGRLHPSFGLNIVTTYRSQSSNPNFQQIPVRDPRLGKMIRQAFIPSSSDHVLVEIDYSAVEVRIAACYHKDPTMLEYIRTGHDLHKDMAGQCFKLPLHMVSKQARQCAKGGFVFAEFYGNWYKDVGHNLWGAMLELPEMECKACGGSGISSRGEPCVACDGKGKKSIREHLASKGIATEKAYIDHIKKVEDHFWHQRFPKYEKWRKYWYNKYLENGWFQMKTGFVCQGVFKRNEVINYAVQGAAFHCLLWSLIQLNKRLKERKMGAKVVGQIHDSVLLDVPKSELQEVLKMAHSIMTIELREAWPWIITPLEIEAEGSDKNWFEKEELEIGVAV